MEVLRSNNDPQIVAGIYLDFVKGVGGCPQRVRTDCGTENVILAGMQCYLQEDVWMNGQVRNHMFMALPQQMRESRHGGPF